jgi:hypothetical protein
MSTEDDAVAFWHLIEGIDEDRALAFERLEHEAVVNYLMTHEERPPIGAQSASHRLDGAVDSGAKSARLSENYFFNRCFGG